MRKSSIFVALVTFFIVFCVEERCQSTNLPETVESEVEAVTSIEIKTREDSIKDRNADLFHAFFMSMAWVESGHTAKITSDNNADGQRSHGWVQITPIFVQQANINRYRHETGKFTKKPKRYYRIEDAYDINRSKEMMYWVNKSEFDKYDRLPKEYDSYLWHKIMKVHNPKAKPKYRNDIMALYRKTVKSL